MSFHDVLFSPCDLNTIGQLVPPRIMSFSITRFTCSLDSSTDSFNNIRSFSNDSSGLIVQLPCACDPQKKKLQQQQCSSSPDSWLHTPEHLITFTGIIETASIRPPPHPFATSPWHASLLLMYALCHLITCYELFGLREIQHAAILRIYYRFTKNSKQL